jgi:hypothetical protein
MKITSSSKHGTYGYNYYQNNTKVIPLAYRSRCLICKEEFDACDILNAKRTCLLHIIQKHKDVWIDHRGELVEG